MAAVDYVTGGRWPMALSNEEQRLLEQMEAALAAEDPKLVNAMRGTGTRRVHRRRAALAGVAFFGGLVLLVVGLYLATGTRGYIALSVLGFVVMVVSAVVAILSWQHVGSAADPTDRPDRTKTTSQGTRAPSGQGFMDKMEERW